MIPKLVTEICQKRQRCKLNKAYPEADYLEHELKRRKIDLDDKNFTWCVIQS